jgi:RND family efflux transporter MFP subunit
MRISQSLLAVSLLFALVVSGCGRPQPPTASMGPQSVKVSLPVTSTITDYEDFTGRTEAIKMVEIRARVTGYQEKVLFKEGTEIKEGEPLFVIDPRTYQAQLNRTEAALRVAEAHLKRLELDYKRAFPLLPTHAISQEDYDKIAGDRDEAAATVKQAEAERDQAQLNLNWTTVTAPISGRISRQMADPGNLIKADDTMLTTIVSLDPIYAYFDVDERTNLKIKRLISSGKVKSARETNVPVMLGLSDEDAEGATDAARFPHVGRVDFVDNREEATTGTLRLRGVFANPRRLLSPGMFVRIRVPIGDPHQVILIPERALASDQGRKYVYVVDAKNMPTRCYVDVGASIKPEASRDVLCVVDAGLKLDDRIVVDGLQRVRPGTEVVPEEIKPGPLADGKSAPTPSGKGSG